jgi:predicted MFS family arabinose efflux permease
LGAVPSGDEGSGYWRRLGEGLAFVVRDRLLRAVVLLVLVTNALDAAKNTVLLPVAAERELGGGPVLGLLVGTMAGGALAGSLLFGAVGHRLPRRAAFVGAFAVAGPPPYLALAGGLPLPVLVAVTLVSGAAAGALNPILGAATLERVPEGMRARVFGLVGAGAWAAMPIGSVVAGVAVERIGLTGCLTAVGVGYLLIVLTPLLGGPWRDLDR